MDSQNIRLLKKMIEAIRDEVSEEQRKQLDSLVQMMELVKVMGAERVTFP